MRLLGIITGLLMMSSLQAEAAEFLGQARIDNWQGSDMVTVSKCGITHIQMQVIGNDLRVENLNVQYGNGRWDRLNVRERFNKGSSSRWIDLNAGARCVSRIYIDAQTNNGFRPSKINFYGLRNGNNGPGWPGDDDEDENDFPNQPRVLAQTTLKAWGDRDSVPVNNGCGIRKVKVKMTRDGGVIDTLRLFFGNGRHQDMPAGGRYNKGESTQWMDLNGNRRCITDVMVIGSSNIFGRKSKVTVYGK